MKKKNETKILVIIRNKFCCLSAINNKIYTTRTYNVNINFYKD